MHRILAMMQSTQGEWKMELGGGQGGASCHVCKSELRDISLAAPGLLTLRSCSPYRAPIISSN